ncbi:acyl transferase [Leeuwenhoekiella marinoflava]|uniref:Acyl-protein synthetase LuxE n=2 Tax=Leeuwenhoekiella marinoflava TaxID=988 RepID=A0A4Q0PRM5_9FLAO|nr:acyl transferase [Leeuwenhoekiella marinoflava]RXG33266.1 acyl-protein synthetase LuxE [Leeuwenhoekiella marinoflava]SHE44967.1 Acyl-protein synthetase, LuxE [Leeuwenhoekiella marinoflava DSM 3653]
MLPESIFKISNAAEFETCALASFQFQWKHNAVYRKFCDHLTVSPSKIDQVEKIPFLPIQFFKEFEILAATDAIQTTFTSSGTTGSVTSKHHVTDLSLYEQSFRASFNLHYGNIEEYTVLALLPSYLERDDSSLIYMVDCLIKDSKKPKSGFYLNDYNGLSETLKRLDAAGEKVLLIGVSFALLDLVEQFDFRLQNTIVMETGGMKGRRKELIREELHQILKNGFGVAEIHSEYGMTELLSQGYSNGKGVFTLPPWMQVFIRDTEDALQLIKPGKTGGINVIDLANHYSCPFIATQDLGKKIDDKHFEIMGRFDTSDIRGCNLMVL